MRTGPRSARVITTLILATSVLYARLASGDPLPPQPSASRSVTAMHGLVGTPAEGSELVAPDLFTGTSHRTIALELPPGRLGIAPSLSLVYSSDGGEGWLGTGWDLELGAVERERRFGVSYSDDSYVLKMGSTVQLVGIGGIEYRAKIEGEFRRIRKLTAGDGRASWEVTDRNGVRYLFGRSSATRQDNPGDTSQVFRWCLERVEDPDGNYYTVQYFKDQGAVYPELISYTGNGAQAPTTTVRFWRDDGTRTDVATSYATNFAVKTVYRLRSIEVRANGSVDRAYALDYAPSGNTARSQLVSVRHLGSDATIGAGGVASGTALPPESFTYTAGTAPTNTSIPGPTVSAMLSMTNVVNYDLARLRYGDFNGDGRTDIAYIDGLNSSRPIKIFLSSGDRFNAQIDGPIRWVGGTANAVLNDVARVKLADINGDGRTDILTIDGTSGSAAVGVYLANANGTFPAQPSFRGPWVLVGTPDVDASRVMLADFNGDGKADILYVPASTTSVPLNVYLSTGSGFGPAILGPTFPVSAGVASLARIKLGDFNGDGRTEIAIVNGSGQTLPITIYGLNAAGTSIAFQMNGPSRYVRSDATGMRVDAMRVMTGDVNGDGKTDFLALEGWGTTQPMSVYLATGAGFAAAFAGPSRFFSSLYPDQSLGRPRLGDFNGDGKTDIGFIEGDSGTAAISIYPSEGYRFGAAVAGPVRSISGGTALAYELNRVALGDFDGDGRMDFIGNNSSGNAVPMSVYLAQGSFPDLLATSSNGIGRIATLSYRTSAEYDNTQLPFPRRTTAAVSVDDGNGVVATTAYDYGAGYYHFGDREFRGFGRVNVTGPAGPDGEQTFTEYWFHQGNDTDVDANDPSGAVGWLQGKPYRVRTWDLPDATYTEKLTTYWPANAAPWFAPMREARTQWCEEIAGQPSCGRSIRMTYSVWNGGQEVSAYDAYGNATRVNEYGDENDGSDDRTIVRTFSPNTTSWIVGTPATEKMYAGAGPSTAMTLENQFAGTSWFYDGTLDGQTCASAGSSATPARGHVTRVVRLLKGGTDPEDWTGYDSYGNVACTSDADRRVTSYAYDGSGTFRTSTTNAKNHVTTTEYYGVGGVAADTGRYGQPKKVRDPNLIETTYRYDVFGRIIEEKKPPVPAPLAGDPYPGFTTTTMYTFGGVGSNRIETLTSAGQWTAEYFDGLGRVYLTKTKGSSSPSARVIAAKTVFNATGTKRATSLPYDFSMAGPRFTTFSYDAQKRTIATTKPDGTRSVSCNRDLDGSSAMIDANGHRHRQVKDVRGNLVSVEEYRGTFSSCATDEGTPYATTRYAYDRMSRLSTITDAAQTQWVTDYDTLGRRSFASDPDLGTWYFGYTAAGDLWWQQDANGTGISPYKTWLSYDELHRLTLRDYPTGTDESFGYDDPSVPYSKGQRTWMADGGGTTSYGYDAVGRPWRTTRTIDGVTYTTSTGYDDAGRVGKETYPDAGGTAANYQYDADGFFWKVTVGVTDRATLTGYNTLGQVGTVQFGSGVVTTRYVYNETGNNRLHDVTTSSAVAGTLLRLTYGYDGVRNITSLTDGVDASYSQTFGYDELDRLTSMSSTALGALAYSYDAIGNVLSKEGITYTYDPIKVHAVKTTSDGGTYDYDNNGNMKSDGTRAVQWDYANRPSSITVGGKQALFAYDGDGQRVKKQIVGGATTVYVNRLYECTGGTCTKHVFAGEKRVALISSDGSVRYHHADHLDSTRVVTDQGGAPVEQIFYRPFGDAPLGETKYRFTSKEVDAETELYFYGARYYNAWLARFVSPDPVAFRLENPQTLNRYSYVLNNPLFYNDPTGYAENEELGLSYMSEEDELALQGRIPASCSGSDCPASAISITGDPAPSPGGPVEVPVEGRKGVYGIGNGVAIQLYVGGELSAGTVFDWRGNSGIVINVAGRIGPAAGLEVGPQVYINPTLPKADMVGGPSLGGGASHPEGIAGYSIDLQTYTPEKNYSGGPPVKTEVAPGHIIGGGKGTFGGIYTSGGYTIYLPIYREYRLEPFGMPLAQWRQHAVPPFAGPTYVAR